MNKNKENLKMQHKTLYYKHINGSLLHSLQHMFNQITNDKLKGICKFVCVCLCVH